MRVVAGSVGGRRLQTPGGRDTRPTTDRVREAIFNALWSMGAVHDDVVAVDLFAGSGALGIEALSRGVDHVHFVDSARDAVAVIEDNLATLGLTARATVHAVPVDAVVDRIPPGVGLVLADPPYTFDGWADLLSRLAPGLDADAVVVCESDRTPALGPEWEVVREKTYGGTVVVFARLVGRRDRTGADA